MMVVKKPSSYSWWWDSHNSPRTSGWLQSTISELDQKTQAMLKLIDEDADSFAKRAEMYYKKRPELVNMVEDFYRSHRSLAERYDQLKSDMGNRMMLPSGWPFTLNKDSNNTDRTSEQCDSYCQEEEEEEEEESDVDDPPIEHAKINGYASLFNNKEDDENMQTRERSEDDEVELEKLREEVSKLREENKKQKEEIEELMEEKMEVIRQLCMSMEVMKEENAMLKKLSLKEEEICEKRSSFELFQDWKWLFSGSIFGGYRANLVAL